MLDGSSSLAAALTPSRPLRCVTLHVASMLYDNRRRAEGALSRAGPPRLTCARVGGYWARWRMWVRSSGTFRQGTWLTPSASLGSVSLRNYLLTLGLAESAIQACRRFRTLLLRAILANEATEAEESSSRPTQ